jgi:hypothetical protein
MEALVNATGLLDRFETVTDCGPLVVKIGTLPNLKLLVEPERTSPTPVKFRTSGFVAVSSVMVNVPYLAPATCGVKVTTI